MYFFYLYFFCILYCIELANNMYLPFQDEDFSSSDSSSLGFGSSSEWSDVMQPVRDAINRAHISSSLSSWSDTVQAVWDDEAMDVDSVHSVCTAYFLGTDHRIVS